MEEAGVSRRSAGWLCTGVSFSIPCSLWRFCNALSSAARSALAYQSIVITDCVRAGVRNGVEIGVFWRLSACALVAHRDGNSERCSLKFNAMIGNWWGCYKSQNVCPNWYSNQAPVCYPLSPRLSRDCHIWGLLSLQKTYTYFSLNNLKDLGVDMENYCILPTEQKWHTTQKPLDTINQHYQFSYIAVAFSVRVGQCTP